MCYVDKLSRMSEQKWAKGAEASLRRQNDGGNKEFASDTLPEILLWEQRCT